MSVHGDARTELFVAVVAVVECFLSVFYESDSVDDSLRRRTSAIAPGRRNVGADSNACFVLGRYSFDLPYSQT